MAKAKPAPEKKLYTVTKTSFINNKICEPGEQVEYAGEVGDNLELVDGEDLA